MRPYLKIVGESEPKEVWCPYEGIASRWVYKFLNTCTRDAWKKQLVRGRDASAVIDCYQEAIRANKVEHIFISSRTAKRKNENDKRSKSEIRRSYIKASIRNIFRKFGAEEEVSSWRYESYEEDIHGDKASCESSDDAEAENNLLLRMVLGKLNEEDREILELYRQNDGDIKACIKQLGVSNGTFYRRFEKTSRAFLAQCGLWKLRCFVKSRDDSETRTLRVIFDVLVETKGDIVRAAEILGMTRKDCRDAFEKILAILKSKCGGMKNVITNCLIFTKGSNE